MLENLRTASTDRYSKGPPGAATWYTVAAVCVLLLGGVGACAVGVLYTTVDRLC